MTSLKSVRKRRQQPHARAVRGLVAFSLLFSGIEKSQQIVFSVYFKVQIVFSVYFKVQTVFTAITPITRPDKHAELLKIHFKLLVKKL